jgi:glutamate formiminotransferase / 5-formyltetrahydrofolate cyclo-ligase
MRIESVVNVSEGRDQALLAEFAAACGPTLLDLHRDADHHRSVFTLAGDPAEVTAAVAALARHTVARLHLGRHAGAHPRLGVLDVVPFVPYDPGRLPGDDLSAVVPIRDEFARWLSAELGVPSFLYGPHSGGRTRTLPQVRRQAFDGLPPDFGPGHPHPTAGATAVGARGVLVAYNVWVSSVEVATTVAPLVRGPAVRALGLALGDRAQVSCNLIDPGEVDPAQLYDMVATEAERVGGAVMGAELVGLMPSAVLQRIPVTRWAELDLSPETTVEARLVR